MISLIELKKLIQTKRVIKQAALAHELKMDEALLAQMLEQLMNMGYILRMPENPAIKCDISCNNCGSSDDVVYCWQDQKLE